MEKSEKAAEAAAPPSDEARHSIAAVEKATGLPRSTLRYYESEFPSFLRVRKSPGGHRRYSDYNIEQFRYLKEELQVKGRGISELREALTGDQDPQRIRRELDLVLQVSEELVREQKLLKAGLERLARQIREIEESMAQARKKGFKWFK